MTARRAAGDGVALVLFLALFAAQAAVIALSPVLSEVASEFGVSTATAGQLRTLSGLAAAVTALSIPGLSRRLGLRALMLYGAALIAVGALLSAAAPSFAVLAAAQLAIGVAVAALVAAGTSAAAAWAPEGRRTAVLSWALVGQPAAWIVGMPLVGALGGVSWRVGWLALPLAAALAALLMLARRPRDAGGTATEAGLRSALREPAVARWAVAELLANCGWAGTLVYAGALLTESYGVSGAVTGLVLAAGAVAYVGGNLVTRRFAERGARRQLIALALLLALAVPLFGAVRPSVATSTLLFSVAAFGAGARTLLGNLVGLEVAPGRRLAAMGIRTAATQLGYFFGSAAAGVALGVAGYAGLGLTLGLFFVAAAAALVERGLGLRPLVTPSPSPGL